jgi:hypothetical protein
MLRDTHSAQPLRSTLGLACLGVGTVGLVLPLIPGIPLLIAGAILLRGRARRNPEPLPADRGLSRTEYTRVKLLLMARRMTTAAESMRLARARRRRDR